MIFSPMNTASLSRVQSPSFIRKRNLPTPPPSDVNDSSSCSSSSSSSSSASYSTSPNDNNNPVTSCDLLNILTDARFRPVFQAIDEIKRRKCRPDLERILKYVEKRYTGNNISYQRDDILLILDELLKYGLITKVFHKGGFTIRIKNEKYAKLIENMNICYNQKAPNEGMNPPDQQWGMSKQLILNSNEMNNHTRETPSPEFAVFKPESSPTNISDKCQMTKENNLISNTKLSKKRTQSETPLSLNKKSRIARTSEIVPSSAPVEHVFRKPLITNNNLPPVTIEQLLGLRGDIPDVHNWTIHDLSRFFHQQGYEYASIVLTEHDINGNKLYELKREQVFHMSTLKIGKALKLWNVIEQIQRNNHSLSSS